jgi:hypothetical protein
MKENTKYQSTTMALSDIVEPDMAFVLFVSSMVELDIYMLGFRLAESLVSISPARPQGP